MSTHPESPFDRAGRYSANLNPREFFHWLMGTGVAFVRWMETKMIAWPGGSEGILDRIAFLTDQLALIFAEAARCHPVWQEALKEWNMIESVVVNEWIRQGQESGEKIGIEKGEKLGIEKGLLIGQIQMLQKLLDLPVSSADELAGTPADQLQNRIQQLEKQWRSATSGTNGTHTG